MPLEIQIPDKGELPEIQQMISRPIQKGYNEWSHYKNTQSSLEGHDNIKYNIHSNNKSLI